MPEHSNSLQQQDKSAPPLLDVHSQPWLSVAAACILAIAVFALASCVLPFVSYAFSLH